MQWNPGAYPMAQLARNLSGPAVLRKTIEPPKISEVVLSSLFYLGASFLLVAPFVDFV